MILSNEFLVKASIDRVWGLLDDLENVIPCMPGARYIGRDGEDNKASIKVKVGAISLHFQGTVRFLEKNETTHVAVVRGVGKDLGGNSSATATIVARLEALSPESTRVVVETDLAMTGRLAQFGGGMIADISSRLISQFTDNLHRAIVARPNVSDFPETVNATTPASEGNTNKAMRAEAPAALDLGSLLGPIVLRYALKYVAVPVGFVALGWLLGRYVLYSSCSLLPR